MKIADICNRKVYLIKSEQPLVDAAREMQQRHVGALVVADSTVAPVQPTGIITDRDIVCGQFARKADLHCLVVADVMSRDPVTVSEESGLDEAIETLRSWGVRRAPVVNAGGDLVGIVTLDDLLPVLAAELNALATLMGTQARREEAR